MSDTPAAPRRVLHLVVEGFPEDRLKELSAEGNAEVFHLSEATAKEALEKIFAADSVAVWTELR
jgi:hypothetical protein